MNKTLTILLSICINSLLSQTNIDYLTGTANINFPVYTLQGRTMEFPVSMNFNTASPKVNDIASWVGLGWSLNAGGAVTREVHGLPDEVRTVSGNGYTWCSPCGGYLKANDILVEQDFIGAYDPGTTPPYYGGSLPQEIVHTPNESGILTDAVKNLISEGKLDLEPDFFQVNAPGLSLKFMFAVDDNRYPAPENGNYYKKKIVDGIVQDLDSVITFPKQDIIVEYTRTENEITSFIITNLDGTVYRFERKQYIQGAFRRENMSVQDGVSYVISWYLTSVTNANGQEEAHFTYVENESYSSQRYYEENKVASIEGAFTFADTLAGDNSPVREGIGFCEACDPFTRMLVISKMKFVRIESIVTPHGKIVFYRQPGERQDLPGDFALSYIHYLNADDEFLGKCELKHDYFISEYDFPGFEDFEYPEDNKRLKLASITFYGSNNLPINEGTQFNYEENGLPVRNSFAQDHWGYFNMQSNKSLACEYTFDTPYNIFGANREPDMNDNQGSGFGCLLMSIDYPDGGSQSFIYEPHDFSRIEGVDMPDVYYLGAGEVANVNHMLEANCYGIHSEVTESVNFEITWEQDTYIDYSSHETGYATFSCEEWEQNGFLNRWIVITNSSNQEVYRRLLPCDEDAYQNKEPIHFLPGLYSMRIEISCVGLFLHNVHLNVYLHYHNELVDDLPFQTRTGGGFRIQKIITSDGDTDQSNNLVTRIEYGHMLESTKSSGTLITRPHYETYYFDDVNRLTSLGYLSGIFGESVNVTLKTGSDFNCHYKFVGAGSAEPLQTENGSFIVYNYIKVFNDFEGQASGYTDYFYDLDDVPVHEGLISGINFSRSWRNNALRRSNTYNSAGELLATVIYNYESTGTEIIYGVQASAISESGVEIALATGVDHNAIRKAQKKAVKQMVGAVVNFAFSWGGGLGMTMATINFAMSLFSWIQSEIIDNNNQQTTYTELINLTTPTIQTTIYPNVTEVYELKSVGFKEFDPSDPDEFLSKIQMYDEYHHHALPAEYAQINVNVPAPYNKVITATKYSDEYNIPAGALSSTVPMIRALAVMKQRNMKSIPIETIYYVVTESGLRQVIGGQLQTYRVVDDLVVPYQVYTLDIIERPYSDQYFQDSYIMNVNNFFYEKPYRLIATYDRVDSFGRPLTVYPTNDNPVTVICEYPSGRQIASVWNAHASEVAFTSFEKHGEGGFLYDESAVDNTTSNWLGFNLPNAKTGKRYLNLTENSITRNYQSGEYILSCWIQSDELEIASTGDASIVSNISEDPDERGWSYREYTVNYSGNSSQTLTISSSGVSSAVDELRFYPKKAMMSTICYNHDGTVHSRCNENNHCVYNGYDGFGKPIWTMDEHYNVRATLKKINGSGISNSPSKYVSRIMLNEGTTQELAFNAALNSWDMITNQFYYDGLGRITQTQALKQSPDGKDIIAQNFFDEYGRTPRKYLPFVHNFEGEGYLENFLELQSEFYLNQPDIKHSEFPFSDVVYEGSPRNRIIESGANGEDWQIGNNHTIRQELQFNEPEEVLFFRVSDGVIINAETSWLQNRTVSAMDESDELMYWPEDKLKKVKMTDENGKVVWHFYDPFDRLILKRMNVYSYGTANLPVTADFSFGSGSAGSGYTNAAYRNHDTYYVYDNYGNLRFEIPYAMLHHLMETGHVEFGEAEGMQNYSIYYNLGFGYKYDPRGNLWSKHSPEVDNFHIIYDDQNRPVMSQDAKQRTSNQWTFIRYDQWGRPAYRGLMTNNLSLSQIQSEYYDEIPTVSNDDNGDYNFSEYRSNDPSAILGYTHENAPLSLNNFSIDDILKVYYYDDYDFDAGSLTYMGSAPLCQRMRGVYTAERTKVLGTSDQFLTSISYYDTNNRPIEMMKSNILDGYDRCIQEFDWRGVLKKVTHEHMADASSTPLIIIEDYNRDRLGRLLQHHQKTGDDRKVMLAGYEYNELGQVRRKHLHIPNGMNTGMQTIDYAYNERGWLRKINNSGLADDGVNLEDYDVFGLQLNYTESDWTEDFNKYDGSPLVPQAMYNGNLASIVWNSKAPDVPSHKSVEKTYVYRYDDMYRLTCGAYAEESIDFEDYNLFVNEINSYLEKTDYDFAGNVTKILRVHGAASGINHPFTMDNLFFSYDAQSNRLSTIVENGYYYASEDFVHFRKPQIFTDQYEYDELGNCTIDRNKEMSMEYNEIGLVSSFTHENHPEDPAIFKYDADGNLLQKSVGGDVIYYLSGAEYEVEDGSLVLRQMATAEGIVRPAFESETNASQFIYDYFLTDHLGNVRVIISEGNATTETFTATMELNAIAAEESEFQYLPYSRDAISIGYPSTAETGEFVAALDISVDHGPARLSKVETGDEIVVSVQSWFPDTEQNSNPLTLSTILTTIASNVASQGVGILDEGLLTLTTDPTWQADLLTFLSGMESSYNSNHPQGYLIYIYFNNALTIDPNYSGMLQVTSPDEIEELQTQLLTMPGEGFFYTYLTNFSDNLVTFDNLTIRHKQGTLRNIHEYYPYGLEYWRSGSQLYDKGDQLTEFHHREWEIDGIEMNRFAARWYDPTIARWHSPDPLEQMHSPYVALCNDPANFVDPDGRAGIHLSDWDKENLIGFASVMAGGAAMAGIGQALQGGSGILQLFQNLGGPISYASSLFSGSSLLQNIFTSAHSSGCVDELNKKKGAIIGGMQFSNRSQRSLDKFDRKEARLSKKNGEVQGSKESYDRMDATYGNKRWYWSRPISTSWLQSGGYSNATDNQNFYSARDIADFRNIREGGTFALVSPTLISIPFGDMMRRINPETGITEFTIQIMSSGLANFTVELTAPGATSLITLVQGSSPFTNEERISRRGDGRFISGTRTSPDYTIDITLGTWLTMQIITDLDGGNATYSLNTNTTITPAVDTGDHTMPITTPLEGDGNWTRRNRLTKKGLIVLQQKTLKIHK
ncbi:MAG: hypothetical protein K1X54_11060 [Flavobacteriales bacterium]|nr:hypothetical protein [Flavobacteriales bacterium]